MTGALGPIKKLVSFFRETFDLKYIFSQFLGHKEEEVETKEGEDISEEESSEQDGQSDDEANNREMEEKIEEAIERLSSKIMPKNTKEQTDPAISNIKIPLDKLDTIYEPPVDLTRDFTPARRMKSPRAVVINDDFFKPDEPLVTKQEDQNQDCLSQEDSQEDSQDNLESDVVDETADLGISQIDAELNYEEDEARAKELEEEARKNEEEAQKAEAEALLMEKKAMAIEVLLESQNEKLLYVLK